MNTSLQALLGLAILGALVALLFLALPAFDGTDNPYALAKVPASTQTRQSNDYANWGGDRIAGAYFFGCTDKDYFEQVATYALQGDRQAFSNALAAGLVSGTCTKFEKDEPVYVVGSGLFSGLMRVRRPGESSEYWTVIEAVD